jgi:primosomal protein N'
VVKKDKTRLLFDMGDGLSDQPGQVVRLAVDTGADSAFDYLLPDGLGTAAVGQRVEVPFGKNNKLAAAFVLEVLADPDAIQKSRRFKPGALLAHDKQVLPHSAPTPAHTS